MVSCQYKHQVRKTHTLIISLTNEYIHKSYLNAYCPYVNVIDVYTDIQPSPSTTQSQVKTHTLRHCWGSANIWSDLWGYLANQYINGQHEWAYYMGKAILASWT